MVPVCELSLILCSATETDGAVSINPKGYSTVIFMMLCVPFFLSCLEAENHCSNGVNQCCQEAKNEGFNDEMFHVTEVLFCFAEPGNGGTVSENVNGDASERGVFESEIHEGGG
jgi:hypothetical protein